MGVLDMLMGKREQPGPEEIAGLFDHSIKDVADPRVIGESPALNKAIMEYQSPDNVEKKEIFTFDSEVRRAPDFYLPYYWAATYHFDKGNFDEAKKILLEGIKKCRIKSVLCRRLGEFCLQKGDVESALYWFFTTVMADTGSIDYHAYLYLAYIFEVYGMRKAEGWSLSRARGISYKIMMQAAEYSARKKENIKSIVGAHKSDAVAKKLDVFYRYAKPTLKPL